MIKSPSTNSCIIECLLKEIQRNSHNIETLICKLKEIDKDCLYKSVNNNGDTLFHIAAIYDNIDALRCLLKHNNDLYAKNAVISIRLKNQKGQTPLHFARSKTMAELLLQEGCSVCDKDNDNYSPLHLAAENGYKEVVIFLLQMGDDIDAINNKNQTPLHLATKNKHHIIVDTLLMWGADVNDKDIYNQTALHLAIQNGCIEVADVLLKIGDDIDVMNNYSKNSLYLTSSNLYSNTTTYFSPLRWGTDINVKDIYNQTPLHLAAKHRSIQIAKFLLQCGASINDKDNNGYTPLSWAQFYQDNAMIEILSTSSTMNIDVKTQEPFNGINMEQKSRIYLNQNTAIEPKDIKEYSNIPAIEKVQTENSINLSLGHNTYQYLEAENIVTGEGNSKAEELLSGQHNSSNGELCLTGLYYFFCI